MILRWVNKIVKKFQINMSNKLFYGLIVISMASLFGIGVYAYGSSNPVVFGHSAGELEIRWNDILGIPTGFADGVDDEGSEGLLDDCYDLSVPITGGAYRAWYTCSVGYVMIGFHGAMGNYLWIDSVRCCKIG